MTPHRRWTLGLVSFGLVMLVFSSWMLQITLPPRPVTPLAVRSMSRKMVHGAPAARQVGRDKRSETGHEPACIAWMLHDFPVPIAVG
jgi:hypothetical protein